MRRFRVFACHRARFSPDRKTIEISVRPSKGSTAACSRCHQAVDGYDRLDERRFEFIPIWGFPGHDVFDRVENLFPRSAESADLAKRTMFEPKGASAAEALHDAPFCRQRGIADRAVQSALIGRGDSLT